MSCLLSAEEVIRHEVGMGQSHTMMGSVVHDFEGKEVEQSGEASRGTRQWEEAFNWEIMS